MRVKKRWNQNSRERSLEQMANAVSAVIWKAAAQVVLNLENDNFETTTQAQRVDLVEEVSSYLVHIADRWVYKRGSSEQRQTFVGALVRDVSRLVEDSRFDVQGPGKYRADFVERFNKRSSDYAEHHYTEEEGGSFRMRLTFGHHVANSMGAHDNKWIPDYIIGREAPEIESGLTRALSGLVRLDSGSI
ncbi:MAG: hypothetical protein AAF420_06195 [Pseudomonadota bacterium]